jgi:hypothetical protein
MTTKPLSINDNLKLHLNIETDANSERSKSAIYIEKTKRSQRNAPSRPAAHIYNSEYPPRLEKIGHGGARLKKDRATRYISTEQALNIIAAADFAIQIGSPLNREICINWMLAGITLDCAVYAAGRFIDLLSKMIRTHGEVTAWVSCFENGRTWGHHCHILIHIPQTLRKRVFSAQRRWLELISGRKYQKHAIRSKAIGLRANIEQTNFPLYLANLIDRVRYILKGAEPDTHKILGQRNLFFQGVTIGKRCSTSQNIGKSARFRANANLLFLRHFTQDAEAD